MLTCSPALVIAPSIATSRFNETPLEDILMPPWIVFRRDTDGVIERVGGLWDAPDAGSAIKRMCDERDRTDDGHWLAERPDDQSHIINWALDEEKKARPRRL